MAPGAPAPTESVSTSSPWTASRSRGCPRSAPGRARGTRAGSSAARAARPSRRRSSGGRRIILRARVGQKPCSRARARASAAAARRRAECHHGEHRGQERDCGDDRDARDRRAADPERLGLRRSHAAARDALRGGRSARRRAAAAEARARAAREPRARLLADPGAQDHAPAGALRRRLGRAARRTDDPARVPRARPGLERGHPARPGGGPGARRADGLGGSGRHRAVEHRRRHRVGGRGLLAGGARRGDPAGALAAG